MPTPDLGPRRRAEERLRIARERATARSVFDRLRRRGKRPDGPAGEGEPAPVRPDRPFDLSDGASAALEFDD